MAQLVKEQPEHFLRLLSWRQAKTSSSSDILVYRYIYWLHRRLAHHSQVAKNQQAKAGIFRPRVVWKSIRVELRVLPVCSLYDRSNPGPGDFTSVSCLSHSLHAKNGAAEIPSISCLAFFFFLPLQRPSSWSSKNMEINT